MALCRSERWTVSSKNIYHRYWIRYTILTLTLDIVFAVVPSETRRSWQQSPLVIFPALETNSKYADQPRSKLQSLLVSRI
jgi:hypothetical protein